MLLKFKNTALIMSALIGLFLCNSDCFALNLKKTIAVSRFENKTDSAGQVSLGTGMADQLADALMQSGKFVVVERQTLEDIIAEQDIAASGRAAVSKIAQTGKLLPAQIIIKGTVTEFEAEAGKGSTGISFSGVSLGSSKATAHVAVILRIIDSTSGQVLDSIRVEGEARAGGMKIGLDISGVDLGTEGFKRTPLGKATQIAIDNAVVKIAEKLEKVPFEGRIIKVEDKIIYTNIGARNGVSVGSVFNAYGLGEEIVDPQTGENLGSEKTKLGSIKITSIEDRFSKAVTEVGGNFESGVILTQ